MPEEYKQLDIAEHVIGLCDTAEKLQRVAHELLLYQERGLKPRVSTKIPKPQKN
jgi:hypothetical protein